MVDVTSLQEQALNAQMMAPAQFDQLTSNIKQRGALESIPYCVQPGHKGRVEVVSGHHRLRGGVGAGLRVIPVLVDTSEMNRSEITAKQIAHNALVGRSDEQILRQMLEQITGVEDMLRTGLSGELPTIPLDAAPISTPHAAFDWRTVTFTFLPHQMTEFKDLIDRLDGRQDLVGVAPVECFEDFVRAVVGYQRVKQIMSVGTAIAYLTRLAQQETATADAAKEKADDDAG